MNSRFENMDDRSAHFFGDFFPTKTARKKARRNYNKALKCRKQRNTNETVETQNENKDR